jgi:hypothetical protein
MQAQSHRSLSLRRDPACAATGTMRFGIHARPPLVNLSGWGFSIRELAGWLEVAAGGRVWVTEHELES